MTTDAVTAGRLGQALRHAALQRTVEGLARVVCDHVLDLIRADRADVLFFDRDQQILWRVDSAVDLPLEGLAGQVAALGRSRAVGSASADPDYRRDIDDPVGVGGEALALEPVLDGEDHVHAVLVLVRAAEPFTDEERASFRRFARRISIVFESVHLESVLAEAQKDAVASAADALFDPVALAAHREGKFGEVVEFPPLLPPSAYLAAGLAFAALLALAASARIDRYASGPALVLSAAPVEIVAPAAGVVDRLDVAPGDRVGAGQAVAHLRADALGLESVVTSPRAGVIDAVRVGSGGAVWAGQPVVALAPDGAPLRLVCAVPAADRAAVELGQPLRFAPLGYPAGEWTVPLTAVGDRVMGPTELQTAFGREALAADGPVIVVEAAADPSLGQLRAGMLGTADVRVADQAALFVVLPFLSGPFGR